MVCINWNKFPRATWIIIRIDVLVFIYIISTES